MNFENLVGQIFQENELYELLLFEIEENSEAYFSKFIHIYFDRVEDEKIQMTEVNYFKDVDVMDKKARSMIEKKEWFEIYEHHGHVDLIFVRFDRSGKVSIIKKNETRTQDSRIGWADETPHKPMTRDEIRQAFQELRGVFQNHQELQKLKSKRAV